MVRTNNGKSNVNIATPPAMADATGGARRFNSAPVQGVTKAQRQPVGIRQIFYGTTTLDEVRQIIYSFPR
ncbi:hypothetical protein KCP74_20785 [Salmonella enterica subsp. enterica]|nr:hypothetical protein KCP74_20785 [Salmonella enterica subsp. enterica]